MAPSAPTEAATMLSLEGVDLTFANGTQALRGLSLTVRQGEFIGLLGPSGCGKSTVLRIAAGLIDYSAGKLEVDRERLGFTFQDATLLPWRNVQQNVELLLELRATATERKAVAKQKIDLVGLAGFEKHFPKHLSGGMKMRVALARALTLDPALFLFDEPFGALDEITRERLNDELLSLYARQAFTGLFVTHSIAEAVYLSSRVVVMTARPGRVAREFQIPFAYPRNDALRYTPEFAQLCGEISSALREATNLEASA
jgi:NitT/TauT family transport system ATP-binding protein